MGLLDQWGNALVEEGLREAADTFFGIRKALDDDITFFEQRVAILRELAPEIDGWLAGLHCLLGSTEETRKLFAALGVRVPDDKIFDLHACSLHFRRPRSLTRKGLFTKTVWEVYAHLADLISRYTHGVYTPDPTMPGRMLLSVNLDQILNLCAELNRRIMAINERNRPSESLGFAKRLDQARIAQESATGGGGETWTLDAALSFAVLDCDKLGLSTYPDLPTDANARDIVEAYCRNVYASRRAHADAMLTEVQDPHDKHSCELRHS